MGLLLTSARCTEPEGRVRRGDWAYEERFREERGYEVGTEAEGEALREGTALMKR